MEKKYDIKKLIRQTAAEGAVLLKNDGLLPFKNGTRLSLFSRVNEQWVFRGYGSGGTVRCRDERNLTVAVRECDSLELDEELAKIYHEYNEANPLREEEDRFCYEEMPLSSEIAETAAKRSDAAIVTIGRRSAEGI